jgi:hypothetical protein
MANAIQDFHRGQQGTHPISYVERTHEVLPSDTFDFRLHISKQNFSSAKDGHKDPTRCQDECSNSNDRIHQVQEQICLTQMSKDLANFVFTRCDEVASSLRMPRFFIIIRPFLVDSWSLLLSNFPVFRVLGLSVCPMVTTFCGNFLTTF